MAAVSLLPQRYELVPVTRPKPHPQNAKLHDIEAISESMEANGFFGAVLLQEGTDYLLAGHGTLETAIAQGLTEIPAIIVTCDDKTALRILLVDNRTTLLAELDKDLLADLLVDLQASDGLVGTGYTDSFLEELLEDQPALILPEEEFKGDFAESPTQREARMRPAKQNKARGLREIVLIFTEDEYHALMTAVADVQDFHSTDSTSQTVRIGIMKYAEALRADNAPG